MTILSFRPRTGDQFRNLKQRRPLPHVGSLCVSVPVLGINLEILSPLPPIGTALKQHISAEKRILPSINRNRISKIAFSPIFMRPGGETIHFAINEIVSLR